MFKFLYKKNIVMLHKSNETHALLRIFFFFASSLSLKIILFSELLLASPESVSEP